jgi:hypothetical protein
MSMSEICDRVDAGEEGLEGDMVLDEALRVALDKVESEEVILEQSLLTLALRMLVMLTGLT